MPQTVAERKRKSRAKARECEIDEIGVSWKLMSTAHNDENDILVGCKNSLRAWRELGVKPGAIAHRGGEWRRFNGKVWAEYTPPAREQRPNAITVIRGANGWRNKSSEWWS